MKKFNIKMTETRMSSFVIEAHSEEEAEEIVKKRIKNDDYFCDEIASRYENGVLDEVVEVEPAYEDDQIDFTYAEMIAEGE